MFTWRRAGLVCLALLAALGSACARPAPPEPKGVSLAGLDIGALPELAVALTPPPAGEGPAPDLVDVSFSSPGEGFSVTASGSIARTADGGATWETVYQTQDLRFGWVETVDPLNAYVGAQSGCRPGENCTGPDVLLRTVDGGKSWTTITPEMQNQEAATVLSALSVRFISPEVGLAYRDVTRNFIRVQIGGPLMTRDGGKTWWELVLPQGLHFAGGVDFLTPDRGFVTASRTGGPGYLLLATRNGGEDWQVVYESKDVPLYAVDFVDSTHGFAAGGGNPKAEMQPRRFVIATGDGGATWEEVLREEGRDSPFASLRMVSREEGWGLLGGCFSMGASGPCGGPLVYTRDGGRTWTEAGAARENRIRSAGSRAWALQQEAATTLLRTNDGGAHWEQLRRPDAVRVQSFQFLTPTVGWVMTNAGTYQTGDGGQSWYPYRLDRPTPEARPLFVTEQAALVQGAENLLRSEDGGESWQPVTLPPGPFERQEGPLAASPDGGTVWTARRRTDCPAKTRCPSVLLRSSDQGQTWEQVSPGPDAEVYRLAVGDAGRGLLIAYGGQLLLTGDGGRSWTTQSLPKDLSIHAATYAGPGLWLAGTLSQPPGSITGALLHSADGGQNYTAWKDRKLWIEQVQFVSATEGWLLGSYGEAGSGLLFRTTDGGRTWVQVWPELP